MCDNKQEEELYNPKLNAQFTSSPPKVLNDHAAFINAVTSLPETNKQMYQDVMKFEEKEVEPQKLSIDTFSLAHACSEYVPIVNHSNTNDDDDDDSNNKTKLIELLNARQNGSILAQLELGNMLHQSSYDGSTLVCNGDTSANYPSQGTTY